MRLDAKPIADALALPFSDRPGLLFEEPNNPAKYSISKMEADRRATACKIKVS